MFSPLSKNILKYSLVQQRKRCLSSFTKFNFQKKCVRKNPITTYASLNTMVNHFRFVHNAAIDDTAISVDNEREMINVKLNREDSLFPFVWLRDNCRCKQCFNASMQARTIQWKDFNLNPKPANVSYSPTTNDVMIEWQDGHKSEYPLNWLQERSFNETNRQDYTNNFYKPKKILWNKDNFKASLQRFDYNSVMNEDKSLYEWLKSLSCFGVALITNVPKEKDSVELLSKRIGFRKKTHYGEEFTINAKPDATNYAYTSNALELHIDLPGYFHKPGVHLLHCYTQTKHKGGENLVSDGLFVANYLKSNEPAHYKLLSTVLIDWQNIGIEHGEEFYCLHRAPIISEDATGEISEITYSVTQRSSHLNMAAEQVKLWYHSLQRFVDLLHDNAANFKMADGDLLSFDNTRLVHGRTGYQDSTGQARYMIGSYMDWDIINSKMRVIYNKHKG